MILIEKSEHTSKQLNGLAQAALGKTHTTVQNTWKGESKGDYFA